MSKTLEAPINFRSEHDGEFYNLPIWSPIPDQPDLEEYELPDGSLVDYEDGFISLLFTGARVYHYFVDEERMVIEELEATALDLVPTRSYNMVTGLEWDSFSCDPNDYITDLEEQIHFCKGEPEPEYKGQIIAMITPDGKFHERDFGETLDEEEDSPCCCGCCCK